jgi:cytochrome c
MKKMVGRLIMMGVAAVLFLGLGAGRASADDKSDAIKIVKAAVAFYKVNGMEKTLDALNDPKGPFAKGELYGFAFDENAVMLANSATPEKLGQNMTDIPDSKGKKFRKEFIEVAKRDGSGWVDYTFLNKKTAAEEHKSSYVEKAGELIIGCGIYKK